MQSSSGAPLLSVGYADGNLDVGGPNQLVIMETKNGDANPDGVVDIADLRRLATNYGMASDARWAQGDFDYDGAVGFDELQMLLANYSLPGGGANVLADAALLNDSQAMSLLQGDGFAVTAVPEPGAIGVLAVAAGTLMGWRRSGKRRSMRCSLRLHSGQAALNVEV